MADAIEKALGDVRSHVELLVKHMVQGGGAFTQTTFPTSDGIDKEIQATKGEILGWFAAVGYDTDLTNWSDTAKEYIAWYNGVGAGFRIEMAHTGAMFTAKSQSRADGLFRMYMKLKESIDDGMSFVEIGIPRITSKVLQGSITGVSKQEKTDARKDTDRVPSYFNREQFRDPRVVDPKSVDVT